MVSIIGYRQTVGYKRDTLGESLGGTGTRSSTFDEAMDSRPSGA